VSGKTETEICNSSDNRLGCRRGTERLFDCLQCQLIHTGWPKKIGTIILYALTLPNINRFSKSFHYQNQEKICNNTITITSDVQYVRPAAGRRTQAGDASDRAIGPWRRRLERVVQQQG